MLKNNLGTGFVTRRKAQILGVKIMAALKKNTTEETHFKQFQARLADLSDAGSTKRGTNSPSINTQYQQEQVD
jgi:hypothetical protein